MDDIHDLKPFLIFAPNWKLLVGVGLVVLALAALTGYLVRRWGREELEDAPAAPRPLATPRSARAQLDRLKTRKLIEAGQIREFHGRLSAIVRGYLGERFAIPGRRLTTTELLSALDGKLDPAIAQMIGDFLPGCDLVKFAEIATTRAEMELRLATAYHLVETLGDLQTEDDDEAAGPRTHPQEARADVMG